MLCINASTGTKVWESSVYSLQEFSSPVVVDGYVYAGSDLQAAFGGDVYALNASTGAKIGNFTIMPISRDSDLRFSSPAVAGNMVYVGIDNTLFAIDVSSFITSGTSTTLPLSDYLLILSVIVVIVILTAAFIRP